jgi:hypothetical protein
MMMTMPSSFETFLTADGSKIISFGERPMSNTSLVGVPRV